MPLLLAHVEEIDRLLLRLPKLVDAAEGGDAAAFSLTREWIVSLENVFERTRMASAVASVAGIRAELMLSETGALPRGVSFAAAPGRRRARQAIVLDILHRCEQCVTSVLAPSRSTHTEAEAVMKQLVAIARHKGLAGTEPPGPPDEHHLRILWAAVLADPDLASGAVRVLGLVPEVDALVLLDRALGTS